MKILLLFLLFSLTLPVFAIESYSPNSETLLRKGAEIKLTGSMFDATKQYNDNGETVEFPLGAGFKHFEGELSVTLAFIKSLDINFGIRGRNNHSILLPDDIEHSGLESYFLGAKYYLGQVPDIGGGYRMQGSFVVEARNSTSDISSYAAGTAPAEELILGDDGLWIKAGFNISLSTQKLNYLVFNLHYIIPPSYLSHEIQYKIEMARRFSYTSMLFGVEGAFSIENSDYSADPAGRPSMSTGSTNLYNSVNRSWFEPFIGFNLALKPFRFELKAKTTIFGQSTDKGTTFSGAIVWCL